MPLFITLRVLGLVNTYWGLILVYMIITLPLSVWMLTSYFKAIPLELEEAAIIDGASRVGILFRITLPLSLPGVVAVLVYAFVTTWNEFIFALCFAHGLPREDAADRPRRVLDRVQHRLGRGDGGLDGDDAADRAALPCLCRSCSSAGSPPAPPRDDCDIMTRRFRNSGWAPTAAPARTGMAAILEGDRDRLPPYRHGAEL